MFFDQNLSALINRGQSISLDQWIDLPANNSPVELQETAEGDYTLYYQSVHIHSPKGAIQEVQTLCDAECHPSVGGTHIILGLGLGYLLEEVFERSLGNIIIYEPDMNLLRFTLENVDLSDYLSSSRVFITTNMRDLTIILFSSMLIGKSFDILTLPSYAFLMADIIPELMEELLKATEEKRMDHNTMNALHLPWYKSFFENVPYFTDSLPFNSLFNYFEKKPALIISYGPSLNDAIPDIKAMQDKSVLIAVGGALRTLQREGITPDFAIFLDQTGMKEQLFDLPKEYLAQISFLLSPNTQQYCYEVQCKQRYLVPTQTFAHFTKWLNSSLNTQFHLLNGGASVSILAIQAAYDMGCDPLIMLGQDLSFRGTCIYADNITGDFNEETGIMTLKTTDQIHGRIGRISTIEGQDGTQLRTTRDYVLFARYLEKYAHANQEMGTLARRFINASVGGAYLKDFEHMSLGDYRHTTLLSEWKDGDILPLEDKQALSLENVSKRNLALQKSLSNLSRNLKEAIHQANDAKNLVEKMALGSSYQWDSLMPKFSKKRTSYLQFLSDNYFISSTAAMVSLKYVLNYNENASTEAEHRENFKVDLDYFTGHQQVFQESILKWVQQAQDHLKQRYEHTVPTLTSS